MATRYWKAYWSMGYAGTDTKEDIDLLDYCESIEEVEALSDEEAENIVTEIAYEEASSMIDLCVEKAEDEEEE